MQKIDFRYAETVSFSQEDIFVAAEPARSYLTELCSVLSKRDYQNSAASLLLPQDDALLTDTLKLVEEKNSLSPTLLVVVGIGGSNLGTMAVAEAVLGNLYNLMPDIKIKVLYADTVDSDNTAAIIKLMESEIKAGGRVLLNAISKSGSTTETMALFQVLLQVLKEQQPDYHRFVVLTSDANSKFSNLANQEGFSLLNLPTLVGGRFSVFSPVGLFPLGLLGLDLQQLLAGARLSLESCLDPDPAVNPALLSAALMILHLKKGININDNFVFDINLEGIGKWYRQLMGESIGKSHDLAGNLVNCGMTPTVSVGSVDLHSMAQLYLGGPYDKLTTFIATTANQQVEIPRDEKFAHLVQGIQGRSLAQVMGAIYQGTKNAFKKGKRPYLEIILPDKSEASLGQLLQFKMIEMMYLAKLLGVNAFDQPNVEDYKSETRAILQG